MHNVANGIFIRSKLAYQIQWMRLKMSDQIHYLEGGVVKFTKEKSTCEAFKNESYEQLESKNKDTLKPLI
ncbi:hypothetical protein SAMN04488029_1472 [Reichenbachiella faecimaris]|uniref:Uncharacterized protein n=1 Tax=Reichenbachiella faecimaris TaxID=692418 RepID=A0A1W2G8W1_REIFA|nr:hypothetical protein SAMN04488029_1472 [Reichenbachiella faecimaris]